MTSEMRKAIIRIVGLFLGICSYAQSLEELTKIGLTNSPEIQKFETAYQRVSEKKNEVVSIPNTQFGFGYFAEEPETRTGAQRLRFSFKQQIPWFGTITARKNYALSMEEASYEDVVIVKRKLIASLSKSYYALLTINKKQEILKEHQSVLKTHETIALAAVKTGKATVVDVLKVQIKQQNLDQLIEELRHGFFSEQAKINTLLNREKEREINVLNPLIMPDSLPIIDTEKLAVHPELLKYDKLYSSVEKSVLLNQKERQPMLGFGLDYTIVSERPYMSFSENGKDILMPMVSLSIPIFNKKYSSKTSQHRLKQQELLLDKQVRQNKLTALLETAVNERIAARIRFYALEENLKRTDNALQILRASYESGTDNFKALLEIQEMKLTFQIEQAEALEHFYLKSAIINYLTH